MKHFFQKTKSEMPWLSSLAFNSAGEKNRISVVLTLSFLQFSIRLLLIAIVHSIQNTKYGKQLQLCQKNLENLQMPVKTFGGVAKNSKWWSSKLEKQYLSRSNYITSTGKLCELSFWMRPLYHPYLLPAFSSSYVIMLKRL